MALYFLDASALVQRYVAETGTSWVAHLVNPASGNTIFLARVTGVEIVSAVARRQRGGTLPPAQAAAALARFRSEFKTIFQLIAVMVPLVNQAMRLAEAHALRAYDAVQLAAALQVGKRCRAAGSPLTLVSSDLDLNAAAGAEGLSVDDPNFHP